MKALVAYMSQTGNTKKVAEAIYGEIATEKCLMKIEDVTTLDGYDIAFMGFPVHGEKLERKVADLVARHCTQGRDIALFVTHGSKEGDVPELQRWLAELKQAASEANVLGTFDCQGQLAKAIKLFMSIYPNRKYRMWAKMDTSHGQPDETRINRAREFARQVMAELETSAAKTEQREMAIA